LKGKASGEVNRGGEGLSETDKKGKLVKKRATSRVSPKQKKKKKGEGGEKEERKSVKEMNVRRYEKSTEPARPLGKRN